VALTVGGYTPAVLDVVPVPPRPRADSHRVHRTGPAATASARSACRPADLAGMLDVLPQRGAQFVAVLAAQVDFIGSAVEGETDGALGLAAIDVVNEQRLDSLRHTAYSTCRLPI